MKTKIVLLAVFTIALLFLNSCGGGGKPEKKPMIPKPTITLLKLGEENSKTAYVGRGLYIKAELKATGKIKTVKITINGGTASDKTPLVKLFDEFKEKTDAVFDKVIDISSIISLGKYTYEIEVVDLEGQKVVEYGDFDIIKPKDNEAPKIAVSDVPHPHTILEKGQRIIVGGTVTDNEELAELKVFLVRYTKELENSAVNAENSIVIAHIVKFDRPASHHFSTYIIVGADKDNNNPERTLTERDWAAGEYYVLVSCKDKEGNISYSKYDALQIIGTSH